MVTHGYLYSYSISRVRTSQKQRLEMIMTCVTCRGDEEEHRLN